MKNIALTLSYCGTNYHGFQRQEGFATIQGHLEKAIMRQTGVYTPISGCGRTDALVHANTYCANFKSETNIPMDRMPFALNSILPKDIVISHAEIVSDDFDARFSCVAKQYTYVFYNDKFPTPFNEHRVFHVMKPLNVEKMQEAAQHFVGKQDFAAVKNVGTPVSSTIREIYYCNVEKDGKYVYLHVCANGFLYNMVRNIAGCLWYVGHDKLEPRDIRRILDSCDRQNAGPTAEPQGLYMTKLFYNQEEFDKWLTR